MFSLPRRFALFLLVSLALVSAGPVAATVLYVDDDDPTCGGFSPCSTEIQGAIGQSSQGDTILVAAGTYQGIHTVEYEGDTYHQVVSIVDQSLTIRGGYPGGGDWLNSDPEAFSSLIDPEGNGRGVTVLGPLASPHDVVLEGLEIRNGNVEGLGTDNMATQRECWYVDADCGGAIYVRGSDLEIRDSLLQGNRTSDTRRGLGGGIYARSVAHLVLAGVELRLNEAETPGGSYGGGLYTQWVEEIRITGSTFASNGGTLGGSAFYDAQSGALVEIVGSTFEHHGGYSTIGAAWESAAWTIHDTRLLDNGVTYQVAWYKVGGDPVAVDLENVLSSHTATSVHFWIEDAFSSAGRVDLVGRHLTLVNGDAGFYVRSQGGAPVELDLTNVLIDDTDWAFSVESPTGNVTATHRRSLIDGVMETHHVLGGTPVYNEIEPVSGTAGLDVDGHLLPGSDAIDAGMVTTATRDLDGEPRPDGSGPDVGADEVLVSVISWSSFETGDLSEWDG